MGADFTTVRPISGEVGILSRTHGSAVFTRGETQALAVVTLGTPSDEQKIETLVGETFKSFMLHYNFPPYSVGETRPMRGPSRREIGHGALAERAISQVLPSAEEFPYTIRIVSEILSSNGSSSMATICGASMSLMDAGVPIKAPWPAWPWASSRKRTGWRCSPTSWETKTRSATWTSRWPAPLKASPPCRWISR